jgi:hypothetical protein
MNLLRDNSAIVLLRFGLHPGIANGHPVSRKPTLLQERLFPPPSKNDQEIFILGTIHGRHYKSKSYSLLYLKTVIENTKPELLLVESRPEELKAGNLGDGPLEMLFSNLTARWDLCPDPGLRSPARTPAE